MEPPPPPPPPEPTPPPPPRFSWSQGGFLVLAIGLIASIVIALAWSFLSSRGSRTGPTATTPVTIPTPGAQDPCGAAQTTAPFEGDPGDRAHANVSLSRYPTIPPASGPHDSSTLPPGSYSDPPPVGRTIHSLEHGAVIIWFDPSLAAADVLDDMRAYMGPSGQGRGLHIIMAPYEYPAEGRAGRLPPGVALAMVAWHRLQYCTRLDADSLRQAANFVANYRCAPGCDMAAYRGEAPEAGVGIG